MSLKARWLNGQLEWYQGTSPYERTQPTYPIYIYDDFICKAVNATDMWTIVSTGGGSVAYTAVAGGAALMTAHTDDTDNEFMGTALSFMANKTCGMEARLAASNVTSGAWFVGFTDSIADVLMPISGEANAVVSTATDAVGLLWDADYTTSAFIQSTAVKNNTDGTWISSAILPVVNIYHTYRVEIDSDGATRFYFDGVCVSTQAAAITATVPLSACVACGTRVGGVAEILTIDYIKAWQRDRL